MPYVLFDAKAGEKQLTSDSSGKGEVLAASIKVVLANAQSACGLVDWKQLIDLGGLRYRSSKTSEGCASNYFDLSNEPWKFIGRKSFNDTQ